jgi:hypothetical protein
MKTEPDRFRVANERLAAAAGQLGVTQPVRFVCECTDTGCFGSVELTLDEYFRRRAAGETVVGDRCRERGG